MATPSTISSATPPPMPAVAATTTPPSPHPQALQPSSAVGLTADTNDEMIDVVDPSGRVVDVATRAVVHATGLRHRVVHVLLLRPGVITTRTLRPFTTTHQNHNHHHHHHNHKQSTPVVDILLARRASSKALGPLLWDLSVAEHVLAGEDTRTAAVRGLREELALRIQHSTLRTCAVDVPRNNFYHTNPNIHDNELVTLFAAPYHGPTVHGHITPDPAEVAQTAWFPLPTLLHLTTTRPHLFTPWMLAQLEYVDIPSLVQQTL